MHINLLAILLAAVSSMVVGTVWFLPAVFGRAWMTRTTVDPNKPKRRGLVYTLAFLAAAVTAVVLAAGTSVAHDLYGGSYLVVALAVASILWVGFTAATGAVHALFEGRAAGIYLINAGHTLVTVLVMAVIIGLFA